jgi:hypothetical protein
MKWQAVMVLLAIGVSITVPPCFIVPGDHGNHAMIGNLDVCHTATPTLSANGNMPCVHQCPCNHMPLIQDKITKILNPRIKPLLITFQEERPPKA